MRLQYARLESSWQQLLCGHFFRGAEAGPRCSSGAPSARTVKRGRREACIMIALNNGHSKAALNPFSSMFILFKLQMRVAVSCILSVLYASFSASLHSLSFAPTHFRCVSIWLCVACLNSTRNKAYADNDGQHAQRRRFACCPRGQSFEHSVPGPDA